MTSPVLDAVRKFFLPFVVWTVTSFLCHKLAKEFLMSATGVTSSHDMTSSTRCILAMILTIAQSVVCLMTVSPGTDLPKSGMSVTMAAHFLATLATNLSMAFIHAASTFAIKLTEPVTMVIAHRLVFKTSVTMEIWFSLPLIITGAFIFTDAALDESTSLGVALAMTSNIILAARNVSMKIIQEKSAASQSSETGSESTGPKPKKVIRLRPAKVLMIGYGVMALCVLMYFMLHSQGNIPDSVLSPYTFLALLGSAVFHVAYSYISTNVVLRVMTVISHSIANIFKRLLVVLLLYAGGHRSATLGSWAGLVVSAVGLAIYIMPQLKQASKPGGYLSSVSGVSGMTMLKRMAFLIGGGLMLLVSVTTFTNFKTMSLEMFDLQAQFQNYLSNQTKILQVEGGVIMPTITTLLRSNVNNTSYVHSKMLDSKENQHVHSTILDSKENQAFLSKRMLDHPEETDFLAKQLTKNHDIVAETQRLHMSVMRDLIGKARHVMLFEIATYENKGDPAITAGETLLFRKMNLTMVYYCSTWKCTDNAMKNAQAIAAKYPKEDLAIFMQGGGNLVGYHSADHIRKRVLDAFPDHLKVLFSQSIWLHSGSMKDLPDCVNIYSNRTNFVMYSRDRQTLGIAQKHFKGIKHMLMPDMVFNIGMLPRQLPPAFDVIWLKRGDGESPKYKPSDALKNVNFTYHVSDYYNQWPSHKGATELETSFLIASAGLQFLQRGRVVITDRLHGHILSTLLNIPHVLFDNPPFHKLSSFHKSWTASLDNVVIVDNMDRAVIEAQNLLDRYDSVLPKLGPYMSSDIWEHPKK